MELSKILSALEEVAPRSLQESYDNAGLICGDLNANIEQALCSLDCTEEVVDEAIARGCQLIIAHHPIVFKGLTSITGKNYVERTMIKAIQNDVAIYASHTNLDSVMDGVNGMIAKKLGVQNKRILRRKDGLLMKLVCYAPKTNAEEVRQALFNAGAGNIGNYDHCSFSYEGRGSFRAGEDSNPHVGERGVEHHEQEEAIEVILERYKLSGALKRMMKAHPYEEVAYDVYALTNAHHQIGSGMIGELESEMETQSFLKHVAKGFNCQTIKHTKITQDKVKRIAFCGGAGRFLLDDAISQEADVFLTSDFKYHDYFDADGKIIVLDIGHFESEQFTPEILQQILREKFPTFAVLLSEVNTNPVRYFIS